MPARLSPQQIAQLTQAERLKGGTKPKPAEPQKPDALVIAIAQQLTALSQRMAGLEDARLKAVMDLAQQSEANNVELVNAITKTLAQRPPQSKSKEVWNFKVTERDQMGRIVTVKAEQTQ